MTVATGESNVPGARTIRRSRNNLIKQDDPRAPCPKCPTARQRREFSQKFSSSSKATQNAPLHPQPTPPISFPCHRIRPGNAVAQGVRTSGTAVKKKSKCFFVSFFNLFHDTQISSSISKNPVSITHRVELKYGTRSKAATRTSVDFNKC